MTKDKYQSIFSRQMEAILFIVLQNCFFFLKTGESGIIQSRGVFRPMARDGKYLMVIKLTILLEYLLCLFYTLGSTATYKYQQGTG